MSRSLGVDYGTKRVGLALSDPLGLTARPLAVVPRSKIVEEVVSLVKEQEVGTIVVGLPTGLGGDEGMSASEARKLADELATATGVDVVLRDERYTSRMAESALLESGMKRRQRRESVDKVAAAIILQDYLDDNR
ncbi:MAG TPA: Holliday junction resolvase RuvX [Acidimicrobiia bacterium]|nr:Holliday junction resolvase RuvX [Acidimicrobiia bacterium]